MVKPVAGEIVVIPFPRNDPSAGKQRPALVIADLPGADLILCQITSRAHWDAFAVPLDKSDCERSEIGQPCFIRPQRLFTVEQHVIVRSVGKVNAEKFDEVFKKTKTLFID
jgi:mRNA interferase MazF